MASMLACRRSVCVLLCLTTLGCESPQIDAPDKLQVLRPVAQTGGTGHVLGSSRPSALAKSDVSKTIAIEGTGRFVGSSPASEPQTEAGDTPDGVTLNLVSVPIAQAAKTILGDMLGVRYTIDPAVRGEVTVQTPRPVAKAAIVDLFQTALRANSAAIVNIKGQHKIVPADQAMAGAPIDVGRLPGGTHGLGSRLNVVQLKYVAASEIQRVLEPIAPRGGIVRADDERHTITLAGNRQEIANMMDAIGIFDVDTMKGMSFALVPVKSSQPTTIAEELRTVFASSSEGPMAGMVRFLPNNRLKAILVITPQRDYLVRAEGWVRRLDAQAQGSERQFFTYAVQNRRAQDLVSVLQSMFAAESESQAGRQVAPPYQEASVQSNRAPQEFEGRTPAKFSGASALTSQNRSPQASGNGKQPTVTAATVGFDDANGSPRIKIAADGGKNALLIEATPVDYERLMRVITTLDVVPNQVLIEATIAEISLTDDLRMGLRWFLNKANAGYTFSDAANGSLASVFPGFSYALTAADLTLTLNTLNKITDVKVVSSPSLTVMDNSTAVLQIGDQVPITTQSAFATVGGTSPIVNSVTYRDTGVILAITPRINDSGHVLLEIEQEVSTVAATTSSNIDSPTIRQRRVKTSVFVNDGDPLVLGGMIQGSNSTTRAQLPILGDLPFVGSAFRNKDNEIGKTELIIIITPRVMHNLQEARRISEDYRRELAIESRLQPPRRNDVGKTLRRAFE